MTQPSAATYPFDARPLVEPVDRATSRAYVRQLRQSGRAPAQSTTAIVIGVVIGVVFLGFFGLTFIGIASSFIGIASSAAMSGGAGAVFVIVPVIVFAVIIAAAIYGGYRLIQSGNSARWYRLDRFAQANGMTWFPEAKTPPLPGMVFGLGHGRVATDILRGDRPRLVEFANYRYKTGSGKEEKTHRWGYVAVKLSTPLPHIVLDAVGNNSMFGSNLPASFDADQKLSLEGDFDRYFALFCPAGYEADALYLFTPDIMARFIDNAAALDVEIVDDWLFLYTPREASTLDPATWAWLFSVVSALLDKLAQWERWRDDRLSLPQTTTDAASALPFTAPSAALRPPGVAAPGQRLKRGFPWRTIIVFGTIFVAFVLIQLGVMGSMLGGLFG